MIKSDMRALIDHDTDTVNDCMIVKESMYSVAQYDPRPMIASQMVDSAGSSSENI